MIDRRNLRLNVIFTAWFLAVAVIPSVFVAFFLASSQKQQLLRDAEHKLAIAARLKAETAERFFDQRMTELGLIAGASEGGGVHDVDTLKYLIDLRNAHHGVSLYLIDRTGTSIYPADTGIAFHWAA